MSANTPLVTVLTPVYNGEKFLKDCIESILNQSYQNWEYIIVNNCSTDATLKIAEDYAIRDSRIRIHNNDEFVDVIENHNIAFRQISGESEYCKLVQADDWLFPECITEMLAIAEKYPSAGVIGAYSLDGRKVRCHGMEYPDQVISGNELSRRTLLGEAYLFWSPTSLMIKSELIRKYDNFYRGSYLHADIDTLYEILQECDFGFVYKVLTFVRSHDDSMTKKDAKILNAQRLSHIQLLCKHGQKYMSDQEYTQRLGNLFEKYYQSLAQAALDLKGKEFWSYHRSELGKIGYPLSRIKLALATISRIGSHPGLSLKRLIKAYQNRSAD